MPACSGASCFHLVHPFVCPSRANIALAVGQHAVRAGESILVPEGASKHIYSQKQVTRKGRSPSELVTN